MLIRYGGTIVATVAVAATSLAIILFWPRLTTDSRFNRCTLAATAVTAVFSFQSKPSAASSEAFPGLSTFPIAALQASHIPPLLPSAFTVALLAAVESLLSAVVADGMSGDHHKSNVELVAQGVANIVSPLFGGIPATGAIARTATNIRSGALTPVAGMIHALTLLVSFCSQRL